MAATAPVKQQQQQLHHHHQRASSTAAVSSAWFDDFYTDDGPVLKAVVSHRRAVSDTLALIDHASSQQHQQSQDDVNSSSIKRSVASPLVILVDQSNNPPSSDCNNNNGNESPPNNGSFDEEQFVENSFDPNMDPKRARRIIANRQSAQRSRIRKLQYIAELEKNVNSLQMEVSALTPQVSFLDHQRVLLNVDNNVLKQRIAALVQNVRLKDVHNDALRKEADRLRQLYQHQQLEMQQQFSELENGSYLRDENDRIASSIGGFINGSSHHLVSDFGVETTALSLKYQ